MADKPQSGLTLEKINSLASRGLITPEIAVKARAQLAARDIPMESMLTTYFKGISKTFVDNRAALIAITQRAGEKAVASQTKSPTNTPQEQEDMAQAVLLEMAGAALHSLAILSSPITQILSTPGENLGSRLLRYGVDPNVIKVVTFSTDFNNWLLAYQGLNWLKKAPGAASEIVNFFTQNKSAAKVLEVITKDAPKVSPKDLIERVRDAQDIPLPDKGGTVVTPRLALPAPNVGNRPPLEQAEAQTIIDSVNNKMKEMNNVSDLLEGAAQTVRGKPPELAETQKTLDAAMQTIRGGVPTAEQTINAKLARDAQVGMSNLSEAEKLKPLTVEQARAALKTATTDVERTQILRRAGVEFMGGGAPGWKEYVESGLKAREAYAQQKQILEGGKINLEDIRYQGEQVGKTLADLKWNIHPGEAVDPIEIAANAVPVRAHSKEFIANARTALDEWNKGNKEPFYRAYAEFHRLLEIEPSYQMPLQTAGQTLRTAGDPTIGVSEYIRQFPKAGSWLAGEKLNTVEDVESRAVDIMRLWQGFKSPEEIALFAKNASANSAKLADPTFRDYARFIAVNSMMSGTDTIGRNAFGITAGLFHYPEKMSAYVAAKLLNPFLSAEQHLEAGKAGEIAVGASNFGKSLWDSMRFTLSRNRDALDAMLPTEARKVLIGDASRFEGQKVFSTTGTTNPFKGWFGATVGAPTDIARAVDEAARIAFFRGKTSELAYRDWLSTGSTIPWREYLARAQANPLPDMLEAGVKHANYFTFNDDPTQFAQKLMGMREAAGGWVDPIMAFIKTPDRIAAFEGNRLPVLNMLSKRFREELTSGDPEQRASAVGRAIWSAIQGGGIYHLSGTTAPDGEAYITGGGPVDRGLSGKLRDAQMLHPYSFYTPFGRMNYWNYQPVSGIIGFGADAREIADQVKQYDFASIAASGALALSRNLFNQTYTKQIWDVVSVFDDPQPGSSFMRAAAKLGASIVHQYTEPGIVRQAFKTIDPTIKENYTFWDQLIGDIPGMGAPPKRNPITGEPVRTPPRMLEQYPGIGWILPSGPLPTADSPIAKKLFELKMNPPDFPKAYQGSNPSQSPFSVGPLQSANDAKAGVPYTQEQIDQGRQAMTADSGDGTLEQQLNTLIAQPGFDKLAPVDQGEMIAGAYHSRIGYGVQAVLEKHKQILDDYAKKVESRQMIHVPEGERELLNNESSPTQPDINPAMFEPQEQPRIEDFVSSGEPQ